MDWIRISHARWSTDSPLGRIDIRHRVMNNVWCYVVLFPDGRQMRLETLQEAQDYAANYVARKSP